MLMPLFVLLFHDTAGAPTSHCECTVSIHAADAARVSITQKSFSQLLGYVLHSRPLTPILLRMLVNLCSFASGTPLSVLDPKGSATIEQTYKRIADNLAVSNKSSALKEPL
jgi:hypothetical protein